MKISEIDVERWSSGAPAISNRAVVADVGRSAVAAQVEQSPTTVALRNLSAEGQKATPQEMEAAIDCFDAVDANFILRCRLVMDCIARLQIDLPEGRAQATGFLMAPDLLMTNHHVLPDAEATIGGLAQFGYWYDVAGGESPTVTFAMQPERFFVNDKELDFAVVALSQTSTNGVSLSERGYLKLSPATGKTHQGKFVTIVQHPDGDPMQIALRENKVITSSQDEYVIRYTADTAHGSSGSPVFNDSFQIAALHSGGRVKRDPTGKLYALKKGGYVANIEDRAEDDVIWEYNVGIRISRICAILPDMAAALPGNWRQVIEDAMAGGDKLSTAIASIRGGAPIAGERETRMVVENTRNPGPLPVTEGAGELIVPIGLRVSLVGLSATSALVVDRPAGKIEDAGASAADVTESASFQIPVIFDDLPSRKGFEPKFLELKGNKAAPAPKLTATGKQLAAPLLDGSGPELRYHKFSVWMQADRRLALFAASNVDWRSRPKNVEGKPITRNSLCGFTSDNVREQWVTDPRIAPRYQLPDVFFTKDYYKPGSRVGAFDKGHITRRDDVCWGTTFDDIQMANGDTFHVTDCSPQISAFNQSKEGDDNWGDLENLIARQTGAKKDSEKTIIYAGPVFGEKDRWFNGRDDDGMVRVQIPKAFWKIVVNRQPDGTAGAYGFMLDQDIVPFTEDEFRITPTWTGALARISEIQARMRGWLDLSDLSAADMYDAALANPDQDQ